jgi:integrase
MPKIANPRDNIVDEFEIVKILKACKDDFKLVLALALAWETGGRISELLQLRPKDFSEEGNLWVCSMPTLKQRVLIHGKIPNRILKIKKDEIYFKIIKPALLRQQDSDKCILFPHTTHSLEKKLKVRYPDVYFHWLRHTRATIWSRRHNIYTLQYAMGWKDIRMANVYVHQEQMSMKMGETELNQ